MTTDNTQNHSPVAPGGPSPETPHEKNLKELYDEGSPRVTQALARHHLGAARNLCEGTAYTRDQAYPLRYRDRLSALLSKGTLRSADLARLERALRRHSTEAADHIAAAIEALR